MSSYTVGLDLGQGQDFSALVVVERVLVLPPMVSVGAFWRQPQLIGPSIREERHVRHLRRWELGTPYPAIVDDVATMMRAETMRDGLLFIDRTGVGRAVFDMFVEAWEAEEFGASYPLGVTITAGSKRKGMHVPKSDLLAAIQVPLQQGTLRVADGLALGPVLERELVSFRQKISDSGRDTFDLQRRAGEGHGDLVTALSLALFQDNTISRPEVVENTDALKGASND